MRGIVKYKDANDKAIASFFTKTPLDLLKTYTYMKEAGVTCVFNEFTEIEVESKYQLGFIIEDIEVNMPTSTDAFVINVYIGDKEE